MSGLDTPNINNQDQSKKFYDARYEQGYLREWPVERKARITEIIQSLDLPETGKALDFGCGNGVLTNIVLQALPGWTLFGTDISDEAVNNARKRFPECNFFKSHESVNYHDYFDFVFSNHVFEHVYDLEEVFSLMNGFMKPECFMFHILPCGNVGSYEHRICLLRNDGINPELGNRFFFEDEGHLRRLTTNQFEALCRPGNYKLEKEYYANQYFGAIEWITDSSSKFVRKFLDISNAKDAASKKQLMQERKRLLLINKLRSPARKIRKLLNKNDKKTRHYLLLFLISPLYLFSGPVDIYWKRKARQEWASNKSEKNGSEMYLFFVRH
ncbi:MAG: hypothetical protein C0623_09880 [Desulfuromonas sp.]|nr:MAG: hypothetical protein C0623_09880 [Desulfuromonas sp.]